MIKILDTAIQEVKLIEPKVFGDNRGYFVETYNQSKFAQIVGKFQFVQDNESKSSRGVLRGLHYQLDPFAQTKLVRVVLGEVLDVAVDIRQGSPSFGRHVAVKLNEDNKRQVLIPRGFAHGFLVLSEQAVFCYKVDNYYSPEHDRGIRFDDASIGIDWGMATSDLKLSDKDKTQPLLAQADLFSFED